MRIQSIFSKILIWTMLVAGISGCCTYSFTGTSPIAAKTVFIDYFPNKANIVNPNLSQLFTEKMRDKFLRQTRLQQIQNQADAELSFTGYISNYTVAPSSVQGNAQATQNRLSITVNVKFENKLTPKDNFEQQFSQFAD